MSNPRTRAARWRYRVQMLDDRGRWGDVAGRDQLGEAMAYVTAQIGSTLASAAGHVEISYRIRDGRKTVASWSIKVS